MSDKKRRSAVGLLLSIMGGLVGLALLAVGTLWLLMAPTMKTPPKPDFPAPASVAEAHRQDLEYLKRFPEMTRSFTPQTRAAFERAVATLEARADRLDPAAFEMGVTRAVALAGDGHTRVRGVGYGLTLNSLPIRLAWFREGLFVVAADPAHEDLLGGRVVSEAGRTPEALTKALGAYVGGPVSLKRERAPHFMISPAALHAAGLAPSADEVSFELQLPDGRTVVPTLRAQPQPANGLERVGDAWRVLRQRHWPRRDLSPIRSPLDSAARSHLLSAAESLPLYLSRPDSFYWRIYLPKEGVFYVQINATRNAPSGQTLPDFLEATLAEVRERSPRAVVIDLRFNSGGNFVLTTDFTKALPEHMPPGAPLFILTSGNTFSAGLITAARLKHFGGARAHIAGERIGDDEQFWAEGRRFVLPNSKLDLENTGAYHDWKNGCSILQIRTCYLMNYRYGVAAGDLSPDIPAVISFNDYLAGEDTVLKAIGARLKAPELGRASLRPGG
jgi:hypothetical protein